MRGPLLASVDVDDWLLTTLFGWAAFLGRVVPRMTVDPGAVVVAAVALVLLTVGMHVAGRKAYRRFAAGRPEWPAAWRLKWTLSAVAMTFLLFTAGISLIGVTHQAAWLATSKEPLTGEAYAGHMWTDTRNALKYVGLGLHNQHDVHGAFPAGGTFDEDGNGLHSWVTHTLLMLNYENPVDMKLPWRHPKNEPHFRSVVSVLINPELRTAAARDADGFGLSHYAANVRVLGPNRPMRLEEITDGISNTLLIGEANTGFRPWGDPVNGRDPAAGIGESPEQFGGPAGTGGATFLMADGSVRVMSEDVDPAVLRALATPAAGDRP